MSDWTSGYVAELDYTHDFFREMTPAMMAFAAMSRGHKQGLRQGPVRYCELGCGQGFTANLLAAANPHIEFHAMDFNPSHIAGARDLARDADLENVHFYERSFADFDQEKALPAQFDIIALHGVMSWVSPENQQHIVDFISSRLKAGGLVYISYNALAGWAAAMPLRRILLDRASQGSGPLERRIDDALNYAKDLEHAGAAYFGENPAVSKRLQSSRAMSRNYLAHELFNADWTPFHFADIAKTLSGGKLNYLGPAHVLDHVDDVSLSQSHIDLLAQEGDATRRESLRDVLVNEQFRTDLFVKGHLPYTSRGGIGAWFDTPLVLMHRYNGAPLKLNWRLGEIALEHDQYAPILKALKQGPQTVRNLLDAGAFGQMTWGEISRILTILVGSGTLSPCLSPKGEQARRAHCRSFNLAVCRRAEDSETLRFLASPVTGGGVELDRFEQLFLLALYEGKAMPSQWADMVWEILSSQGQRVHHEGRVLEDPEENLAVLRVRATAFAARRLPICKMLGITLSDESERGSQSAPTTQSGQHAAV